MVFVKRDTAGRIIAVSRKREEGDDWEASPDDAPDLAVFTQSFSGQSALASSDLGLVRVLEDVIDLLVEREVIRFTDLPEAAQKKLCERRSLRASLGLKLLGEDEGETI